jgi:hypothetical protein
MSSSAACVHTYVSVYIFVCVCVYVCMYYVCACTHVCVCVFCLKEARGLKLIFQYVYLPFHPRSKSENTVNENSNKYLDDGGT